MAGDSGYTLTPVAHDPFADAVRAQFASNAQQEMFGNGPSGGLVSPDVIAQPPMMQSYTPTLSERLGAGVQDAMESAGASRGYAQGFGQRAQTVAGLVPGVGQALSAYDAGRAGAGGDYGGAALAGLAAFPMAGAAGDAARLAEEGVAKEAPQIIAYHGSPHSFDRFDLSKIGTGEGAQAYGHGLYFADNEGVAKAYRDTLSSQNGARPRIDGKPINLFDPLHFAAASVADMGSREKAASYIESVLPKQYSGDAAMMREALEHLRSGAPLPEIKSPGSMYQVGISANPDHFLDWDKPLSEQHPVVQQALAQHGIAPRQSMTHGLNEDGEWGPMGVQTVDNHSGADAYRILGDKNGGTKEKAQFAAAQLLQSGGIPGIKYLDAGSRASGDGSRNYVVFDDKTISILKKYGLAGLGIGAGADALMDPSHPASAATRLTPVDHDPFSQGQ